MIRHKIWHFAWYSLLSTLLLACQNNGDKNGQPAPVSVVKVQIASVPVTKEYIGITQSIASVDIRARVKGFLTQMNFVEGKPVKKDASLFVIDPLPFEADVKAAEGNLAKSIANREFQTAEYERYGKLVKKGDVSVANYDRVKSQYQEAVAQVQINQANLDTAKINLSYCYMNASFDGIIGEKFVDVGNLVGGTENTLLATLVELNPMYIQFSPSVSDFALMLAHRKNMPFKVEATFSDDANMKFHGKVDLINNQADTPTSTILMRALLDNPESLLLPGIYLKVKLTLSNGESQLIIPVTSVMEVQGQRMVYIIDKNNEVQSRAITTNGQYQQSYIIVSGLKEGEMVVTNNLQKIKPGLTVTPQLVSQPND